MKSNKRNLHGVVLLDKPAGVSSNHALQRVKHLLGARKAGHTGSLDPLATGLLPICLGQATKVSEYLLGSSKQYTTRIKLGETTDTLDAEGTILESKPVDVSAENLAAALAKFRGEIEQTPPMYSALKKDGQPLYKLARKGEVIERKARKMTVHELRAERIDERIIELKVHCSSGFYIRSLADDLGKELGCGAHVIELRRTAIKSIDVAEAIDLESLLALEQPEQTIKSIDVLLPDFARIELNEEQVEHVRHGRRVLSDLPASQGLMQFLDTSGHLLAIGEIEANGLLKTHKLFVYAE